jgi:hypothetical protein
MFLLAVCFRKYGDYKATNTPVQADIRFPIPGNTLTAIVHNSNIFCLEICFYIQLLNSLVLPSPHAEIDRIQDGCYYCPGHDAPPHTVHP